MAYLGYARRFRPKRFDEVVGQESVVLTLRHALEEGRVSHAYLFAGPRGVGKTTTARILARALNCEKDVTPDPCGECARCAEIAGGGSLDVIEVDAASHSGVDSIRELRDAAHNATHGSRYRLYILDEVHMLSTAAFNALLKILEEPPSHVKFVLCTTDPQKVPETVRSRCTRLDFRRIAAPQVVERLGQIAKQEELDISEEALRAVALHVRGGMRDAEVLLEQLSIYADGEITAEHVRALTGSVDEAKLAGLCEALGRGEAGEALAASDVILDSGTDTGELIDALLVHLRGALAVQACGESDPVVAARGIDVASAKRTAGLLTQEELLYCAAMLQSARKEARVSEQPRIVLELALVRLSRVKELVSLEEIAAQMSEGGVFAAGAAAARSGGRLEEAARRPPPQQGAYRRSSSRAAAQGQSRHAAGQEASPFLTDEGPPAREPQAPAAPPPEPVPAPPTEPAPEPVKGELTLETVRERWNLVRSRVERQASSVGALLRPAEPTGVAGGKVTLTFPAKYTFHMNGLLAEGGRLALVESAASEIIGRPVRVSLESSGGDGGAPARKAEPPGRTSDFGEITSGPSLRVEDPRAASPVEPVDDVVQTARPGPSAGGCTSDADAVNAPSVQRLVDRFRGQVVRVDHGAGSETDGGSEP